MSAEKCGERFSYLFTEKAVKEDIDVPTTLISARAFKALKKIKSKFPYFNPISETEIWMRAYNMGLMEED